MDQFHQIMNAVAIVEGAASLGIFMKSGQSAHFLMAIKRQLH